MKKQMIIKMINEEIIHLKIIKKIIEETGQSESAEFIEKLFDRCGYPFFRKVIGREVIKKIKFDCPFANRSSSDVLNLLTGPGQKKEGFKEIKSFLSKSECLSIVDPYFFNPPPSIPDEKYLTDISKTFIRPCRKKIEVYCLPSPKTDNKTKFVDECKKNNIEFKCYVSDQIHDRVIIADDKKGLVIGTSFGGLGNKYAFILPLPKEDLDIFKKELFKLRK